MKLLKLARNKKPKKNNEIDYFILFGISGFTSMYLLHKRDDATTIDPTNKLIYLSAFCIILFIFSAAKCKLFNLFKYIRMIPKLLRQFCIHLNKDFIQWKNKEGYYAKKKEL